MLYCKGNSVRGSEHVQATEAAQFGDGKLQSGSGGDSGSGAGSATGLRGRLLRAVRPALGLALASSAAFVAREFPAVSFTDGPGSASPSGWAETGFAGFPGGGVFALARLLRFAVRCPSVTFAASVTLAMAAAGTAVAAVSGVSGVAGAGRAAVSPDVPEAGARGCSVSVAVFSPPLLRYT